MSAVTADIPLILEKCISSGLLSASFDEDIQSSTNILSNTSSSSWAHFYDLDALDSVLSNVLNSFPDHFLHCFAVKSNPLKSTLQMIQKRGLGFECASFNEVVHSLQIGCSPKNIVFDSPCKTKNELHQCLKLGVLINCDNFDEMNRVASLIETNNYQSSLQVGLRVNPLLGKGTIETLSVSTHDSKFGIPLTEENRNFILEAFQKYSWLNGLHCHVGSQGCGIEMLAMGAAAIVNLANEIDDLVASEDPLTSSSNSLLNDSLSLLKSSSTKQRIRTLDIGGGLPTNFDSDQVTPTFTEYVDYLKLKCPKLFSMKHRRIITEFGRALICKCGWTASRIEYVKITPDETKKRILIIHAGSDMFLRTCYSPESFPLRIEGHQCKQWCQEKKKHEKNSVKETLINTIITDVAGPLCFGGDKVGKSIQLNLNLDVNDWIVIRDTGANCLSLWSRHCSRAAPQVIGYKKSNDEIEVMVLKQAETTDQVLSFWG
jgi:diaminopimelate decarboxylase